MLLRRHLVSVSEGDLSRWMPDLTEWFLLCSPCHYCSTVPFSVKRAKPNYLQPSIGTRLGSASSQQGKAADTVYKSTPFPISVTFHLELWSAFHWQKLFPASTKCWILYVPDIWLLLEYRRPSLFSGHCASQAPFAADRRPLSNLYYTMIIACYMYLLWLLHYYCCFCYCYLIAVKI